jgi:hypothetical protein
MKCSFIYHFLHPSISTFLSEATTPDLSKVISQERIVNNIDLNVKPEKIVNHFDLNGGPEKIVNHFDLNFEPEDQLPMENLNSSDEQHSPSSAAQNFVDPNQALGLLPSTSCTPVIELVSNSCIGNHVKEACKAQRYFPSMGSSNRHRKRPMIILDPSSASEEIS